MTPPPFTSVLVLDRGLKFCLVLALWYGTSYCTNVKLSLRPGNEKYRVRDVLVIYGDKGKATAGGTI